MEILGNSSLLPLRRNEAIDAKWGDAISAGFIAVPNTLVKYQAKIGITQNEFTVIMNLLLHWWFDHRLPFPSTRKIADRSGLDLRTVQRAIKTLKAKRLVEKIKSGDRYVYDLEGLRVQLEMYAESDLWSITKRAQSSNVVEMESTPELT